MVVMKQVDKSHYNFSRYCYPERWASYYYQLQEVLNLCPKSVLEIGAGDGVFKNYIKSNTDIFYKNMDIAEDLHPDVVGSVENIPFPDESFDLVCAFEVLEHIAFKKFDIALGEMVRVSRRYIVISIPHFGPALKLNFKLPFFKEVRMAYKISLPKKHKWNGQHYWEMGKSGYSRWRIEKILEKHGTIKRNFVPYESQYHHFYVVEK